MTNKKTEELNEAELDQVTGGGSGSHDAYANLEVSHLKPGLTEKTGKRAGSIGVRDIKKNPKGFMSTGSGNPTV